MPAAKPCCYHLLPLLFSIVLFTSFTVQGNNTHIIPSQKKLPGDSTTIEFKVTTTYFDTIKAGTRISAEFDFTNTGKNDLVIETVKASDGGTVAYWPELPIPPGKQGTIKVLFGYTESRTGYQDKIFYVECNAVNGPVSLHLIGYIKK